jgi:hypothetical protein
MDDYYKSLYKQATNMQYKMHDYTLQSAHDPATMVLRNEVHKLTNDLATSRSPLTIESRIKTIERQLHQAQIANPSGNFPGRPGAPGQMPIMHYDHSNFLNKNLEGMRANIRQHPHY